MKITEEKLQELLFQEIRLKWPNAIVFAIPHSGKVKLTPQQSVKMKRLGMIDKIPDILCLERRHGYGGLFIELKVVSPFKQNGGLKHNPHIEGQFKMLTHLKSQGYYATFAIGYDDAITTLEWYLQ